MAKSPLLLSFGDYSPVFFVKVPSPSGQLNPFRVAVLALHLVGEGRLVSTVPSVKAV